MLSESEYVVEGGVNCPVCGQSNISGGSIDKEDSVYIQEMVCHECDAQWNDVLKLEGISNLQHGKLVVELKLGDTSYGKRVIEFPLHSNAGDMIEVDTENIPDSDRLYCEDPFGYRYVWHSKPYPFKLCRFYKI